jgi:rhodanese-related sulfurtransferase/methyl-accepting chemotaxis protein
MSNLNPDNTQQLLAITQKLGKSAENTTRNVQQIKAINGSLVEITQKQYQLVNQVFSEGEHIKESLSDSVNKADSSLSELNQTVQKMEVEFTRIEESIQLFDKIRESTQSLNNVARHTKMLALNTAVLGGSLGKDGSGINIVAHEMQELVKTCEGVSKHIDDVVVSARDNVQNIVKNNRIHMQASLENTASVDLALQALITLFKGCESADSETPSVNSIITAVGAIEQLANEVTKIVDETQSKTESLNNEVEVANQAVSDLVGVVTNSPITNLSPKQALEKLSTFRIIDVRRDDEFNDQLGHIQNAKLCTINETSFKKKLMSLNKEGQYLFVCRSGGRSSRAARVAQTLGFPHIYNLDGGMLAWDKGSFPVAG